MSLPTQAQIRMLRSIEAHGENGYIEHAIKSDTALAFKNADRVHDALQRKGAITDDGELTDYGRALLRGAQP